MSRCWIVGAAPAELPILPKEQDFVIAADGGLETLQRHGITPHLLLGDFDSFQGELPDLPTLRFPVKKDDTDSALAVKEGLKRGFDRFVLLGCLGGALDHTLANLSLLAWLAEQGNTAVALDGDHAVTALCNGKLSFSTGAVGRISIFSHSNVSRGVTLKGLLYSLKHAELTRQVALGVSNQFIGQEAAVSVERGTLLIYTQWKNFDFFLDQ